MKNERFVIRAYGKSELAMLYLPELGKATALRQLRKWLFVNKNLRYLLKSKGKTYTPKQVRKIVEEIGEPFDLE